MKGISGEESGLFHIPNDDKCENCKNYVSNGICCGSSKNGLVDETGEWKCFEPKEK